MSAKLDQSITKDVLIERFEITQDEADILMSKIIHRMEEMKPIPEEKPAVETIHIGLLSDSEDILPKNVHIQGWVLKVGFSADEKAPAVADIVGTLGNIAQEHNDNRNWKRDNEIKTFGDLFDSGKAKYFKPHGIKIITKEPVVFLPVHNEIPTPKPKENE